MRLWERDNGERNMKHKCIAYAPSWKDRDGIPIDALHTFHDVQACELSGRSLAIWMATSFGLVNLKKDRPTRIQISIFRGGDR